VRSTIAAFSVWLAVSLNAGGGFLAALLRIVTRCARNRGKTLSANNRTVEFDEILTRKWRKFGRNHLTILIQHDWLYFAGAFGTTLVSKFIRIIS
jgi:hypothetical protein